jgi:hypothetical protein
MYLSRAAGPLGKVCIKKLESKGFLRDPQETVLLQSDTATLLLT